MDTPLNPPDGQQGPSDEPTGQAQVPMDTPLSQYPEPPVHNGGHGYPPHDPVPEPGVPEATQEQPGPLASDPYDFRADPELQDFVTGMDSELQHGAYGGEQSQAPAPAAGEQDGVSVDPQLFHIGPALSQEPEASVFTHPFNQWAQEPEAQNLTDFINEGMPYDPFLFDPLPPEAEAEQEVAQEEPEEAPPTVSHPQEAEPALDDTVPLEESEAPSGGHTMPLEDPAVPMGEDDTIPLEENAAPSGDNTALEHGPQGEPIDDPPSMFQFPDIGSYYSERYNTMRSGNPVSPRGEEPTPEETSQTHPSEPGDDQPPESDLLPTGRPPAGLDSRKRKGSSTAPGSERPAAGKKYKKSRKEPAKDRPRKFEGLTRDLRLMKGMPVPGGGGQRPPWRP